MKSISKYGFLDDGPKVRVYVDFEGANKLPKDQVKLTWEKRNFSLVVDQGDGTSAKGDVDDAADGGKVCRHILKVDELYADITAATVKQKASKFVITLKKQHDTTWYQLKD